MIITKSQLINDTKQFSHQMLAGMQNLADGELLDSTILEVMSIYEYCAEDTLKGSSLRIAKKNREIFALSTLLRACAAFLLDDTLSQKYVDKDGRKLTKEGQSLYKLHKLLLSASDEYVGAIPLIHRIDEQIETHLSSTMKQFQNESRPDINDHTTNHLIDIEDQLKAIAQDLIEKAESGSTPSCKTTLMEEFSSKLSRFSDLCDLDLSQEEDIKSTYAVIVNLSFDMLASGKYHLYTGTLNPLDIGPQLLKVYKHTMKCAVDNGYVSQEEYNEQLNLLQQQINIMG